MKFFERFFQSFFPFLIIGIGIVLAIMGLFLFSYLLIGGAIVALVLYIIAWVRTRFAAKAEAPKKTGRIIEGDYEKNDKNKR